MHAHMIFIFLKEINNLYVLVNFKKSLNYTRKLVEFLLFKTSKILHRIAVDC